MALFRNVWGSCETPLDPNRTDLPDKTGLPVITPEQRDALAAKLTRELLRLVPQAFNTSVDDLEDWLGLILNRWTNVIPTPTK